MSPGPGSIRKHLSGTAVRENCRWLFTRSPNFPKSENNASSPMRHILRRRTVSCDRHDMRVRGRSLLKMLRVRHVHTLCNDLIRRAWLVKPYACCSESRATCGCACNCGEAEAVYHCTCVGGGTVLEVLTVEEDCFQRKTKN